MHIKEFKMSFLITVEDNLYNNIFSPPRFTVICTWLEFTQPQQNSRMSEFFDDWTCPYSGALMAPPPPPPLNSAGRPRDLHPKPCCLWQDKTVAVLSDLLMLARKPLPQKPWHSSGAVLQHEDLCFQHFHRLTRWHSFTAHVEFSLSDSRRSI